jgi:hypothetical protein
MLFNSDDFLNREKLATFENCSGLLREIMTMEAKTLSTYEVMYRKIVSFVLLKSHAGSPTDIRVIREATAALESVFPQSGLNVITSIIIVDV